MIDQSLNRYQILSLLGEGGMGTVFKARDVTLQRDVAIKVMHPQSPAAGRSRSGVPGAAAVACPA